MERFRNAIRASHSIFAMVVYFALCDELNLFIALVSFMLGISVFFCLLLVFLLNGKVVRSCCFSSVVLPDLEWVDSLPPSPFSFEVFQSGVPGRRPVIDIVQISLPSIFVLGISWNFNPDQKFGLVFVFSIKLALLMEIIGFSMRFLSSFLWVQMYRLGVSTMDNTTYCADYNVRDSFVNPPTNEVARQTSNADKILGGSVYDPAYYSSLFEDIQETQHMTEVRNSRAIHEDWDFGCKK
ncbi:hypothetical protein ZIOFF_013333 [Zingiber officinale]|uniref:Transmembrane protein n=1 Tax=Zingiber officinale TaxID=94328 RepID=A0A8J5HRS0_ZINOF|nr:hypothetical protein ZIOFF_013333 [Zingiber officinale]